MQGQASLDRRNFETIRDFSILVLRFLDGGKFILAGIIFPGLVLLQFHAIWCSQCRERAAQHFERMKRFCADIVQFERTLFPPDGFKMVPGMFWDVPGDS